MRLTVDNPQLTQFRLFAGYNADMNRRLYDLAAQLTDGERKQDRGAFFGSLHRTLNHLLLADRIWMARFATGTGLRFTAFAGAKLAPTYGSLGDELYADFDELRRERVATDDVLTAWIGELTPETLAAPMRYANTAGVAREHPLWFAIAHLFNHQTHHRSQATTLLNQIGKDYGTTDFLVMYPALAT
jgi:uncharacterized damage-inducible protein DinB